MHICPINVETSVLDLVQTWTCLESSPTSSPHPSSACCLSIKKDDDHDHDGGDDHDDHDDD